MIYLVGAYLEAREWVRVHQGGRWEGARWMSRRLPFRGVTLTESDIIYLLPSFFTWSEEARVLVDQAIRVAAHSSVGLPQLYCVERIEDD